MRIRNFAYLDLKRALDWLAQVQGGLYRELQLEVTEKIGKQSGFDAKGQLPIVDVGLGFQRSGSSEETETVRAVVEHVAPSYVARLFDQLEEQDALDRLDDLDEERWGGLQRGAIIEARATISLDLSWWLRPAAGGGESFLEDAQARAELRTLHDPGGSSLAAVAELAGTHRFRLMFALERGNLLTKEGALNNEFELLAQVERKFGDGKIRIMDARSITPVALVSPVAIY